MRIRVLGGHGGMAQGFSTTSFLINDDLLIDAGNVAGPLTIEKQKKIDNILVTHCHLDHIKDLAFISDNCFGLRSRPFLVHAHHTVNEMIKKHLLNDIIWPDFSKLPSLVKPTLSYCDLVPMEEKKIGNYLVTGIRVNHPLDAMGYVIDDGQSSVIFTGDTGPTDEIWRAAHSVKNLKAIFTEVSFPDHLSKIASLSYHHTPHTISVEMKKMPKNVQIVLTHLKPNYRVEILDEMSRLGLENVHIIDGDGDVFDLAAY